MPDWIRERPVMLGLYRMEEPELGERVRVRWAAGDGAPFLPREIYEALHFKPAFDALPSREEYERQRAMRNFRGRRGLSARGGMDPRQLMSKTADDVEKSYNVLFLCTRNSTRSILAESILAKEGAGRFRAFSAGSDPSGTVHPMTREVLQAYGFPVDGLRSKSWDEFKGANAPHVDFIFTLCDDAAGESCPVWPGHPITAHWGIEDPLAVAGDAQHDAFLDALRYLRKRIELFLMLPVAAIDKMTLAAKLRRIGQEEGATGMMPA
jgi:arsenate reductase